MFYDNIKIINNPNRIDILVNKNNKLPDNHIPNDLEPINSKYSIGMQYLRHEAKINFEQMCEKAHLEGIKIFAASTYRSSDYQDKLYNNYCLEKGIEYADACSARKGHSEHQTGLAVDIADSLGEYNNFGNNREFNWIKDNAFKYGFILRYPKFKTDITGFKYEPWHFRYIGKDIANYIYNNDITLEEYKKSI